MSVIEIPLTQGYVAKIDEVDLPIVSQYSWRIHKVRGLRYAQASIPGAPGKSIFMHRVIMNATQGLCVDHRDGDGLNNTRSNLRFATQSQNNANQRKQAGRSSRFKGVYWFCPKRYQGKWGKWCAYIQKGTLRKAIGYFDNEEDAARAYDAAALELFGEFARLNFPKAA